MLARARGGQPSIRWLLGCCDGRRALKVWSGEGRCIGGEAGISETQEAGVRAAGSVGNGQLVEVR